MMSPPPSPPSLGPCIASCGGKKKTAAQWKKSCTNKKTKNKCKGCPECIPSPSPPPASVCGMNTNYVEHSGGKKYSAKLGKPKKKVQDANACAGLCDKNVQCAGYIFKDNKKVAKRMCTLTKQGGEANCAKTEVCCKAS
jgi:hypothetical protein